MSIRIRVGLSRKVGEPNYSSRGASIELEAEIDNHVASDSVQFQQTVKSLYGMARQSIDCELERTTQAPGLIEAKVASGNHMCGQHIDGQYTNGQQAVDQRNNGSQTRVTQNGSLATESLAEHEPINGSLQRPALPTITQGQIRAIYALARQQQLNPCQCALQQFGKLRLEALTIREASQLIDMLKNRLTVAGA